MKEKHAKAWVLGKKLEDNITMGVSSQEYTVIRSFRRTIAIHITQHGDVEVRAPFFVSDEMMKQYIASKQDWIRDTKLRIANTKAYSLENGKTVPFLGKLLRIQSTDSYTILRIGDTLCVPHGMFSRIQKNLEIWYRKEAKKIFAHKTAYFSEKIGTSFSAISIRDTTSRWGSCSSSGRISYCWRLLLAREEIVDYVVIHEVCHRIHPNHSHAFWDTVGKYDRNYRAHRTWLKRFGNTLVFS